jgi:DNA gyrase/topoisomerase IV subunit A
MRIETSLSGTKKLNLTINFDELVENYAPELLEAFNRRLSVLDELPTIIHHIEDVVKIIRSADSEVEAKETLAVRLNISPLTAERTVSMSLSQLTELSDDILNHERTKILLSLNSIIKEHQS